MEHILTGKKLEQAKERETFQVIAVILGTALSAALFVALTITGWSSNLRDALGGNTLTGKAAYIAVFFVLSYLLEFPLGIFFDYTLGKRYGLLKQNFGGWVLDNLKNWAVSSLIFGALMLALYSVFAAFPQWWFPVSLVVVVAAMGLLLLLSPRLARLNHKSAPLENAELETRVRHIFDRAGVKLTKVSRLMVGEKTKTMNAALSPDGVGTEVLMSDTLIENIDPEGIETVLAHEIGHKVHKDIPVLVALTVAQFAIVLACAYVVFSSLNGQFGLQGAPDIATLPLFFLCFTVVGQFWMLLVNAYKRHAEYRADNYAMRITQNPAALERAFRVLANQNLSDPNPPAWIEFWLHDHPSLDKRVAATRRWAAQNPTQHATQNEATA